MIALHELQLVLDRQVALRRDAATRRVIAGTERRESRQDDGTRRVLGLRLSLA